METLPSQQLPSKEEFDRIAANFKRGFIQAVLPGLIQVVLEELRHTDRVPYQLRQLLESQRISEQLAKKSASPRRKRC